MRIQRRWLTGALLTMPVMMGRSPSASAQLVLSVMVQKYIVLGSTMRAVR